MLLPWLVLGVAAAKQPAAAPAGAGVAAGAGERPAAREEGRPGQPPPPQACPHQEGQGPPPLLHLAGQGPLPYARWEGQGQGKGHSSLPYQEGQVPPPRRQWSVEGGGGKKLRAWKKIAYPPHPPGVACAKKAVPP